MRLRPHLLGTVADLFRPPGICDLLGFDEMMASVELVRVDFTAWAAGGQGGSNGSGNGASGAAVTGYFYVPKGTILTLGVGQGGQTAGAPSAFGGGGIAGAGPGGTHRGGNGGGRSWIAWDGVEKITAGAGAGGNYIPNQGGGGGLAAQDGTGSGSGSTNGPYDGKGATTTSGGATGTSGNPGTAGSARQGGNGGPTSGSNSGAGGGGGYFGGGGGSGRDDSIGGGAGGGSSYAAPEVTATHYAGDRTGVTTFSAPPSIGVGGTGGGNVGGNGRITLTINGVTTAYSYTGATVDVTV